MKTTFIVDRQLQNEAGKQIVDFKSYFDHLIAQMGYIKAKQEIRRRCHIFVCIK